MPRTGLAFQMKIIAFLIPLCNTNIKYIFKSFFNQDEAPENEAWFLLCDLA